MIDKSGLMQARNIHRQAVEMMYEGSCCIYEKRNATNPDTKITSQKEVLVFEDMCCRLSFSKVLPAYKQAEGAKQEQQVRLFIAPEIVVKPGSKIIVSQNGMTETYKMSSLAAVYTSHQEIVLDAWEGWT
ncbi:MAG: hypothetical protein HDR24_00370 [Lachnospiraceae bacterium]|nr:hypothetical protein [Lachnospiraceae bacterium]